MSMDKQKAGFIAFLITFFLMGSMSLAADKSKWPQKMNVATGPVGGAVFTTMSFWCPLMNNALGVNISPESTGGVVINIHMVNGNQADFGATSTDLLVEAWEGTAEWAKGQKLRNVRSMAIFESYPSQIYSLKSSNISDIYQLSGKSVNLSRAGTAIDLWMRRIFEMFNIKPSKITNLNPSDANNLLGDRLLHAACVQGSIPHPAITEASVNNEIAVFGLPAKELKLLTGKNPTLNELTIPANTYKGQKEPFNTFGPYMILIVNKDIPADLVFQLLEITFKNKEQLAAVYKPFTFLELKNAGYVNIPLHKGAYQFYQKAGISVPKVAMPIE